jgi:hypothetical protein
MQSILSKYLVGVSVVKVVNLLLICFLLFLSFFLFQYREPIMVKLGMSHFFSPGIAGVLPWVLLGMHIAGVLCLVFWDNRKAAWPALLVFGGYTAYNITLLVTTGSNCGCANIFFDVDLRTQIAIGAGAMMLTIFLLYANRLTGKE